METAKPRKRGGVPRPDKNQQELALGWTAAQAIKRAQSVGKRQIVETLRAVAKENGVSYETVRSAYYKSLKPNK
jgi:hypothetical protein